MADRPLTRTELGETLMRRRRFKAAGEGLMKGDTLLKALMWQGDLCFGPVDGGRATLQSMDRVPGWAGLVDVEDAGPRAIADYFRSYGPATPRHVHYWLGEGLSAGRKALNGWLDDLGDRLVPVDVDGVERLILAEDHDDLVGNSPSPTVTLLPGADPWVMGAGTADPMIVPPARRALMTGGANPVLVDGVVSGTWSARAGTLTVTWFPEAGRPDSGLLGQAAERLTQVTGDDLDLVMSAGD